MDRLNEMVLSKDGGTVTNISKGCDGFIDRSKVRILLCDNDSKSSEEVFKLLCGCSYQVTSVRSPRQVIDALNAEGPDIDIILSEVDIPMPKGLKMLKYIMRDKGLRRIPVIMMSAQDEVAVVVKCLRLGAADYLVKPLRTNELLNLWTHMWRRRRMLGLEEKNIMSYDFDLVASDPSDANTNSTTLFSDDTVDKSRKSVNLEACASTAQQDEIDAAMAVSPPETTTEDLPKFWPDVHATTKSRRGQISAFTKKGELKIGESSAFFTYVKSSMLKMDGQVVVPLDLNTHHHHLRNDEKLTTSQIYNANNENHSNITEFPTETTNPPPLPPQFSHHNITSFNSHNPYPYYMPAGVMNQHYMMTSSSSSHHHHMLPPYNHIPHYPPHLPPQYPYYPWTPSPGHMPAEQQPQSRMGPARSGKIDRREAALIKFRQKRKERCFDKKIRYVKRKRLAEKRPRVRGQFVRKDSHGLQVDLNGQPASADYDDDDDDDEEDDNDDDSSP
jgi:pseudo-response regulator 1